MANDEFWINSFDRTGNHPIPWLSTARELDASADILMDAYLASQRNNETSQLINYPPLNPLLMLRAAAIECLLKAIAITQGNTLAKDGKYKPPKGGKGHNLTSLANAIGIERSIEESDLLERLSLFVEIGRYPIYQSWERGLKPSSIGNGDKVLKLYWSIPVDEDMYRSIFVRFRESVLTKIR